MKIWRMRISRWIPKATDTHSEYVITIFRRKNGLAKKFHCYFIRKVTLGSIGSLSLHAIQYQPLSRSRNCSEFL